MTERITIDPVTRLEGHGRIEIFLDGAGEVANAYFQVPEFRGFEQFCVGRPVEEMPLLTNRICGVCPEAHHMAAAKACDAVYHVQPPPAAVLLRRLLYAAFYFADHTTDFYALAGPDFVMGPDAPVAERNLLGIVHKLGLEVGGKVIKARKYGHAIVETVGGRGIHPCTAVPGGMAKGITAAQAAEIAEMGRWAIEFVGESVKLFDDIVLGNPAYLEMVTGDTYTERTYYMGTVDAEGRLDTYDGRIRVVSPDGEVVGSFAPAEYRDWIAERVEPWTYLKFPYLKKIGWKGFVGGADSGVYCATPLARLNVANGLSTPRAQAEFERFFATLAPGDAGPANGVGHGMVHHRLAGHWARLVELMYAAESIVGLATNPDITSDQVRTVPTEKPTEGVGSVEAPRGTLFHHYWTDERGVLTRANLIVGTTNNYAPMAMSVSRAARSLIHGGTVITEGLLNRIEMAFRAYDPCLGCATHSLPGRMPMIVTIRGSDGAVVDVLRRDG
jgi:F420-non-reducing hydrogenase large subunit